MNENIRCSSKGIIILLLIFLLALSLRIFFLQQIKTAPFFNPFPGSDSFLYDNLAKDIASGRGIEKNVLYALSLYPYFLSLIYIIIGHSLYVVRLIQMLIGAVNCILVYFIAKKTFNEKVGLIASFMTAIYSVFILYEMMLLPTGLIIFLNLVLILSLLSAQQEQSPRKFFLAGLFLGICALAKAAVLIFSLLIFLWIFVISSKKIKGLVYCLNFFLGIALIISFYAVRNYMVWKKPLLIPSHSGINFYIGNNPDSNGTFNVQRYMRPTQLGVIEDSTIIAEQMMKKKLNRSEVSNFWISKSFRFIRSEPVRYLKLLYRKFILFWSGYELHDAYEYTLFDKKVKLPFLLRFGTVCPLALPGMILCLRQYKKSLLLYLFILSCMVSIVLFFFTSRYRLPAVPFFIIFAAYTIYWWFVNFFKEKKYGYTSLSLVLVIGLFFGINNIKVSAAVSRDSLIEHYSWGVIYDREGLYEKAVDEFVKAIRINPYDFMAHYGLGNVYYKKGEFDSAVYEYKKAIEINPYYVDAHYNLGFIYQAKGSYEPAIAEYEEALNLKPDDIDARFNLANIYKKQNLYEKAISEYKEILKSGCKLTDVYSQLGDAYFNNGQFKEAKEAYLKALNVDSDFSYAKTGLEKLKRFFK